MSPLVLISTFVHGLAVRTHGANSRAENRNSRSSVTEPEAAAAAAAGMQPRYPAGLWFRLAGLARLLIHARGWRLYLLICEHPVPLTNPPTVNY